MTAMLRAADGMCRVTWSQRIIRLHRTAVAGFDFRCCCWCGVTAVDQVLPLRWFSGAFLRLWWTGSCCGRLGRGHANIFPFPLVAGCMTDSPLWHIQGAQLLVNVIETHQCAIPARRCYHTYIYGEIRSSHMLPLLVMTVTERSVQASDTQLM